jgi:hypothetical protein
MSADESTGPRVFSIEQANSLVGELSTKVGRQLVLGNRIEQLVVELLRQREGDRELGESEVVDITVQQGDSERVRMLKRSLGRTIARYRRGWSEVEELGAVVKDPREGQVDFYGRVDDRLVWLCWQYGQDAVEHYQELDAAPAERKPLAEVRKRMLN